MSEILLEVLEEEETVGGAKSFDLGFLFDEVIPKFLATQGERFFSSPDPHLCHVELIDICAQTCRSCRVARSSSPRNTRPPSPRRLQLSTSMPRCKSSKRPG